MFEQPQEVQEAYDNFQEVYKRHEQEQAKQPTEPQPEPFPEPDMELPKTPIDIKVMRIVAWMCGQYPTLRQIWNHCPGCQRQREQGNPAQKSQ